MATAESNLPEYLRLVAVSAARMIAADSPGTVGQGGGRHDYRREIRQYSSQVLEVMRSVFESERNGKCLREAVDSVYAEPAKKDVVLRLAVCEGMRPAGRVSVLRSVDRLWVVRAPQGPSSNGVTVQKAVARGAVTL